MLHIIEGNNEIS